VAYDGGITFFDAAEVYGPYTNEELVGQVLAHVQTATGGRPLGRAFQCVLIVSHKLLNALGSEFVCKIKAIPWKIQI